MKYRKPGAVTNENGGFHFKTTVLCVFHFSIVSADK
jgi:hypothetical protein